MKRWIVLTVPLLLIAAVAFGQLITGGTSGGGSGISSVAVSTPLTGNGVGSPIAIVSPLPVSVGGSGVTVPNTGMYLPPVNCNNAAANFAPGSANRIALVEFWVPAPGVAFSRVGFYFGAGDAVNNYDIGLYNSAGTLVADSSASPVATASWAILPMSQGTVTLLPGNYFLGYTGQATTASITACGSGSKFPIFAYYNASFASPTTTAGALATSITVPSPGVVTINSAFPVLSLLP